MKNGVWAALAASLAFAASPANACSWALGGEYTIHQSNGLYVQLRGITRGEANGRIVGRARFWSPTFRAYIPGTVSGNIGGNRITMYIEWEAGDPRNGPSQSYHETGYYRARIGDDGQITGTTYPLNRRNAVFDFAMTPYARCD